MNLGTKVRKVLVVLLVFAVAFVVVSQNSSLTVSANAGSEENVYDLPTSNLIKDGGFENVTTEDTGAWIIDTTSEAAQGGSWSISTDPYAGSQAINLVGAGNKNGYPEVAQIVEVFPNTNYYFTFRLRNNDTSMSGANVFFGFASESREDEEQYTQQHRWADNVVDVDQVYKIDTDEDGVKDSWEKFNGFSLFSGVFNTGNHTKVRAFIRLQKMNATIDNVTLTIAEDLINPGAKNLLKHGGFEGTDVENKEVWVVDGELEEGMGYGFDDVRATPVYMPGVDMQDKQIEGYKNMYIVANSGVEDKSLRIKQEVEVEQNTFYAFYAYLSKWGLTGLRNGVIGVMDAEGNILSRKKIAGEDISLTRYMLASVVCNTGENDTVYVFVEAEIELSVGAYGVGLYVDDAMFFKTGKDLSEGKTDLILNGDFADMDDEWWLVGGPSQVGAENGGPHGKSYASENNIWLSQWNPGDGIYQEVQLKGQQMYKVVARVRTYFDYAYGTKSNEYDGLYSPVSIIVSDANGNVAKALYRFERNDAYIPVSLIFTPETDGVYRIFIGFEGGCENFTWQGGMQIGSVSMYETSLEELSVIEEEPNEETYLTSTDADITISENTVNVNKKVTVKEFKDFVYTSAQYTMKVVGEDKAELADTDYLTSKAEIQIYEGETLVTTFAVAVPSEFEEVDKPGNNLGLIIGLSAGAVLVVAAGAYVLIRRKKQ